MTYPNNPESFGYDMSSWFTMVGSPTSSWNFIYVFTVQAHIHINVILMLEWGW